MTKERNLLGKTTIVGLTAVKEAVQFHNSHYSQPENVPITKRYESGHEIWPCNVLENELRKRRLRSQRNKTRLERKKKRTQESRKNKSRCLQRGGQLKRKKRA